MKVKWDVDVCCHSGKCVRALPAVFKIEDGEFTIDPSQGSDEDVQRVVGFCPSGALKVDKDE